MNDNQKRLNYIQTEVLNKIKENNNKLIEKNATKIKNLRFIPNEKKGEDQFQSISIFGEIIYEFVNDEKDDNTTSDEKKVQVNNERSEDTIHELKTHGDAKESIDKDETGMNKKTVNVIIKMQIGDEISMQFNNGGVQFFNEVFFYSDILPYFKTKVNDIDDLFPKFLYGNLSPSNSIDRFEDIIILENLNPEGYVLAPSKSYLSLQHILLGIKGIGKFHACSYIMKSIDPNGFFNRINQIKNTRGWISNSEHRFQNFLAANAERGYKYLKTVPEYANKLDAVRQFIDNISESLNTIFEINDKTSVLCHGDFCRNNMFFKYDESKTPLNVKLFDVATILYASPVIDVSFFLYLNTNQELRLQHWNTIIETYYESILKETSKYENVLVPTYEEILNEFKFKSMMSYFSCSFFLPMMLSKVKEDRSTWGTLTPAQSIERRLKTAGEEGTKAVGDILIHVIDNGFI